MKSKVQFLLQRILGYDNYLFCFSIFSIYRMRFFKKDKDFLFFLNMINKTSGSVIIDVGANIGVTTTTLAKYYPNRIIYSYEPISANFNTIIKVLKNFNIKSVNPRKIAIGESEGVVELTTPIENGAKKHGLSRVIGTDESNSNLIIEQASLMPLDNLLPILGSNKVAAIKLDVENYEIYVLKGAKKLLLQHRPIVFAELWDNERKNDCILLMESLGYETKVHVDNELVPYKGKMSIDYFFIPLELLLLIKSSN